MPALDISERKAIAQLLPRVKRKFVKTIQTSTGKDVQYMEPAVMPYRIPDGGRNRSVASRRAAWVCLPYFSLESYSGLLSAERSHEFPIQTLLQAQFSKTARERDMQQAVCQIGRRGNGRCFHIAQLWCLIIDKCDYFLSGPLQNLLNYYQWVIVLTHSNSSSPPDLRKDDRRCSLC